MNVPMNNVGKKPFGALLQIVVALSLAYYVWIMLDLLTHPYSTGSNYEPGPPYLFRWLSAISGTFTVIVALFIIRRVRGNVVGPLLLFWGVASAGWSLRIEGGVATELTTLHTLFALYFYCISSPALIFLLFYFPSGRVYPGWAARGVQFLGGVLVIVGLITVAAMPAFIGGMDTSVAIKNALYLPGLRLSPDLISVIVFALIPLIGLGSLVLRYRDTDTRGRLQIKWLAWLMAVGVVVTLLPSSGIFGQLDEATMAIARVVSYLFWQMFPALAIGVAMLRHNLWDIDVVIRRTLVYSTLTVMLALIYFGSVVVLQELLTILTGEQPTFAVVISTLLIAGLFSPLRRKIQDMIDRRFYRRKYDAQQVLARFAEKARDETDPDRLAAELIHVVQETVQPASVTLWLVKK